MIVGVWDTYVTNKDGTLMNFDIMVPESETDPEAIYRHGKAYLESKGMHDSPLTSNHCTFCHIETATDVMVDRIKRQGYYVLELKNC